ncbi:hypothetical protein ACFQ36_23060, partial [Arthrobacter sp. GCM10027362]|uniref:hypothetical protein n=1 Tax=Arthrobacter sp. GCM10027362 TaxID=3273379 RepID=UPI00362E5E0C
MDLKEAAAAEAREHLADALAAVEEACLRSAVEYLADFYLHSPEDPTDSVYDTAYTMDLQYWGRDYPDLPRSMWETSMGEDMEASLKPGWILALANQLLATPGAGSLRDWAGQEAGNPGGPADAAARLLGSDPELNERTADAFVALINKAGRMTVRQVLESDKGGARRRAASRREEQNRPDKEEFQRLLRCQEFYRENKAAFLQACGLEDRRLGLDDRAAVEDGVGRLGWTLEQRVMFAEGAPRKALGSKLRGAMKQRGFGAVRQASASS